jgi:hypothetical protein
MTQIATKKPPTQKQLTAPVIEQAVAKLANVTDERAIRKIIIKAWKELTKLVPNSSSFNAIRAAFRKAIELAFPCSEESKPGYYFTIAGKDKPERYEHLALWYATTSEERWKVVGDEARAEYFKNLKPFPQPELQPEPPTELQPELQPEPPTEPQPQQQTLNIENMTVENLKLDVETQQIVEDAIAQSGMSLPEFLQQACRVYAKTITGKTRKHSEDLSNVETEVLRNNKAYGTHPGRAEELVKRAIRAIKYQNGLATELSQKWMITQSLLVDMTGAKASAVKNAIAKYPEINDYNKALRDAGATDLLNRKGELKEDFCEEWLRIVESGID